MTVRFFNDLSSFQNPKALKLSKLVDWLINSMGNKIYLVTNDNMHHKINDLRSKVTDLRGPRRRPITTATVCTTGGEPSTWFPPERLVEQEYTIFFICSAIFSVLSFPFFPIVFLLFLFFLLFVFAFFLFICLCLFFLFVYVRLIFFFVFDLQI